MPFFLLLFRVTQPHIWYVHAEEVLFFSSLGLSIGKRKKKINEIRKIDPFFFFFFPFLFDMLGFFCCFCFCLTAFM